MLRVSEDGNRRRESYLESYRQLGRSLLELQNAADRVFDAISRRTAKEREILTGISQRIQTAKARIDAVSRSKQGLIIKSPSRYPSNSISEEDFHPLFQYEDEQTDYGFITKLLVNGGLNREFGKDGTQELFQFFSEDNTESSVAEAKLKVGAKLANSNENTFLEDLLQAQKVPSSSFLEVNSHSSESTQVTQKQELPPLPPSLVLHNIPSLRRSEDFTLAQAEPEQGFKLPDICPELAHPEEDVCSDFPTISDVNKSGE